MHNNFAAKIKGTKMVNKKIWIKMLVIVLVFGMTMAGLVFPARVGADDLWANVPNLDLLNGTWKGSYSKDQTVIEAREQQKKWMQDEPLTSGERDIFDNLKQTYRYEVTIIINKGTKTVSMSRIGTITYSGGKNLNKFWEIYFGKEIQRMKTDDDTSIKYDDEKHSYTVTFFGLKSFDNMDENIRFQINQNRTKLKIIASSIYFEDWNPNIWFPLGVEIIMTKQ